MPQTEPKLVEPKPTPQPQEDAARWLERHFHAQDDTGDVRVFKIETHFFRVNRYVRGAVTSDTIVEPWSISKSWFVEVQEDEHGVRHVIDHTAQTRGPALA